MPNAISYTPGKPDKVGGPLAGSTCTWKSVCAGRLMICGRDTRQSGTPSQKYTLSHMAEGESPKSYCRHLGDTAKARCSVIPRLQHTWIMAHGWEPCGHGDHAKKISCSRYADRPATTHRKAHNQSNARNGSQIHVSKDGKTS